MTDIFTFTYQPNAITVTLCDRCGYLYGSGFVCECLRGKPIVEVETITTAGRLP